jgi:very-short-patch-repair endonuclease
MHWEARFHEIARTHEGLVAKFHLPEVGLDSRHWWRAVRTGRWLPMGERVVRSIGAPETEAQRVLGAVLDASPGAVLHRPSALAWLGVPGFNHATILVARARGITSATSTLACVHRVRALRPQDVIVVRGVATETALRAIWAEAARHAGERRHEIGLKYIGNLLDRAHRLDLVTWGGLHESVDDLHQRGRAGTAIMRELARERPPGSSPTESRLETQFEDVLDAAGTKRMRRQRAVGGHEPIGRCDFADDDLPLVTEVNSLTFHTTPTDRAADERRYQALIEAGFMVCVIWEPDLWARPRDVVATVADARRRASAGQRFVVHSPGCPWPPPLLGTPMCP